MQVVYANEAIAGSPRIFLAGLWAAKCPRKVILGAPVTSPKNAYLFHLARKCGIPAFMDLQETVAAALSFRL